MPEKRIPIAEKKDAGIMHPAFLQSKAMKRKFICHKDFARQTPPNAFHKEADKKEPPACGKELAQSAYFIAQKDSSSRCGKSGDHCG